MYSLWIEMWYASRLAIGHDYRLNLIWTRLPCFRCRPLAKLDFWGLYFRRYLSAGVLIGFQNLLDIWPWTLRQVPVARYRIQPIREQCSDPSYPLSDIWMGPLTVKINASVIPKQKFNENHNTNSKFTILLLLPRARYLTEGFFCPRVS